MEAESDVEVRPLRELFMGRRRELGEAHRRRLLDGPLSEAHRRRLYAEELSFLERESLDNMSRDNHLRKLIGRESSMYLGGSSEEELIKAIIRPKALEGYPRPSFYPYYWTERARQLIRALNEETSKLSNLLTRRRELLEKLEDERLCIVDRGDGRTKREYECVPASARLLAGRVHEPEQNIGRARCTDEALAEAIESRFTGLVFTGSHSCVSSDMPGTWPDPSPEAPLMESAQHVLLRPPRGTQVCAA